MLRIELKPVSDRSASDTVPPDKNRSAERTRCTTMRNSKREAEPSARRNGCGNLRFRAEGPCGQRPWRL